MCRKKRKLLISFVCCVLLCYCPVSFIWREKRALQFIKVLLKRIKLKMRFVSLWPAGYFSLRPWCDFCVKSYSCLWFYMKSGKVFWKDGIFEIKARARLKVCNWILRHVWNSQMSMKFKLPSAGHKKVGWMKLAYMLSNCNVNLNKTPLRDIQTNYMVFFLLIIYCRQL